MTGRRCLDFILCKRTTMKSRPAFRRALLLLFFALSSCATGSADPEGNPPAGGRTVVENAARRGLVDVRAVAPGIICELRYGTHDNVTGRILYPADMPCLLQRATAEKLARARDLLHPQGLGLKIWDAWRPPEVHAELFRYGASTGRPTLFVNPQEAWSFHCSGTAVDITLVDSNGHEIPMPSNFDEAGPLPSAGSPISDGRVMANLARLRDAMLQSGFTTIDLEWWHFDDASFTDPATHIPAIFAGEIGLALPALR